MALVPNEIASRLARRQAEEEENLLISQQEYGEFASNLADEADDDEAPVFNGFKNDLRDTGIRTLSNFNEQEFLVLWSVVEPVLLPEWTFGRGRKHKTTAKDAFFMMLVVLKHFDTWVKHAADFSMNPPTFQKMIEKVCCCLRLVW